MAGVVPDIVMRSGFVRRLRRAVFEHSIPWSRWSRWKFKTVAFRRFLLGCERVTAEPAAFEDRGERPQFSPQARRLVCGRKKDKSTRFGATQARRGAGASGVVPWTTTCWPGEADKVKGRLDKWRDDLARDPWLEEALRVAEDMRPATNVAASPAAKK
jgi:hypothetical protein